MNEIEDITDVDLEQLATLLIKTYDSPGRGRKLCKCGKYVGAKSRKCVCGYDFAEGPNKPLVVKDKDELEAERLAHKIGIKNQKVVLIGAGKCPITLNSLEPEKIEEWCQLLINHGQVVGLFFSPLAMRFYLGQFYGVNTSEYKIGLNHLNSYLENIQ